MQLSLTQKLFTCFLALTIVVLVATLGLARWSFERGFLDYVNTLERGRMERAGQDLLAVYKANGYHWDGFSDSDLHNIMNRHHTHGKRPPPMRQPVVASTNEAEPGPRRPRLIDRPAGGKPPKMRMALVDPQGTLIAGAPLSLAPENVINHVIKHDEKPIAELRTIIHRTISSPDDAAFADQQTRQSAIIGGIAMLLAALVSLGLSRVLLKPIHASIASVARLSSGDYKPNGSLQRHDEGNDELARLASDLEHLRKTLHATRKSRQRLLADISHELRTPITILSGEISALLEGLRPLDKQQLQSLEEEVNRLKHLVDDLNELALSDVSGLRYEFQAVELEIVISNAIDSFQLLAKEAGISIEFSNKHSVAISGDTQRLHQLFSNLIKNSVSYTDPPGCIRFTLTQDQSIAHIVIEDSPPSTTVDSYTDLFDALYRDEQSRNRHRGGAGLGLAICRNIVKAHRGQISAGPSTLGGLQIDIKLPKGH
jgi:two-component system sensor histidine kinase BaeS